MADLYSALDSIKVLLPISTFLINPLAAIPYQWPSVVRYSHCKNRYLERVFVTSFANLTSHEWLL